MIAWYLPLNFFWKSSHLEIPSDIQRKSFRSEKFIRPPFDSHRNHSNRGFPPTFFTEGSFLIRLKNPMCAIRACVAELVFGVDIFWIPQVASMQTRMTSKKGVIEGILEANKGIFQAISCCHLCEAYVQDYVRPMCRPMWGLCAGLCEAYVTNSARNEPN